MFLCERLVRNREKNKEIETIQQTVTQPCISPLSPFQDLMHFYSCNVTNIVWVVIFHML